MDNTIYGKIYSKGGIRGTVFIGPRELDPKPSQKLLNHSPDGFAWGYGGSGPAQLALAILLYLYGKESAEKNYQAFKSDVIAAQDTDEELDLPIVNVARWMEEHTGEMRTVHDEDCPKCGFPETVIVRDRLTMEPIWMVCSNHRKCNWKKTLKK